tara:strand:+ start:71 stop:475 length:405 start_codon:yes stop_codon:yes gene_type:complete
MKTPQELQSIFDKFPKEKIELKGAKLELGIIDDLEKASKNLFSDVEKAGSSYVKYDEYLIGANKPFGEMIKNYDKLIKSLPVAEEMSKRFLKAGEELGVDVKNNKTYLIINQNIKMSNNVIQSINNYDDPSSFL